MYEIEKITNTVILGDALQELKKIPSQSVNSCITSPPYWGLRDYGVEGQLGNELSPDEYIKKICDVFDECKRIIKDDGVLFVNISDSYFRNGGKSKKNDNAKVGNTKKGIQKGNCKVPVGYLEKSLALIPQKFAIEMSNRGWIVRNQIIWHKPNAMPQPVRDRFVNDYEIIYMFTKNKKYKFNLQKENITGKERIKRSVWSINTKPNKYGHIAPFPIDLIMPCILSSTNEGDIIIDPFMGSGTVALGCILKKRKYVGIEISKENIEVIEKRLMSCK